MIVIHCIRHSAVTGIGSTQAACAHTYIYAQERQRGPFPQMKVFYLLLWTRQVEAQEIAL